MRKNKSKFWVFFSKKWIFLSTEKITKNVFLVFLRFSQKILFVESGHIVIFFLKSPNEIFCQKGKFYPNWQTFLLKISCFQKWKIHFFIWEIVGTNERKQVKIVCDFLVQPDPTQNIEHSHINFSNPKREEKNMKWQREKLLIRTRRLWGWFRKYFKFGNRTTGTRAGSYFLRSKNLVLENSNLNKKLCEFMRENKKGVKIFFPILSHNFPFSLLFSYYLKSIFVKHFVILGISHFCGNTDTQICHKSNNNTNIWNSAAVFLGRAHCAESCLHL